MRFLVLPFIVAAAFAPVDVAPRAARRGRRGPAALGVADRSAGVDDAALDALWRGRQRKALLRVGGSGVKASHINSLVELVGAHTVVVVKSSAPDADAAAVAEALAGDAPFSYLGNRGSELMFSAAEDVPDALGKLSAEAAATAREAEVRVCYNCGEPGHESADCPHPPRERRLQRKANKADAKIGWARRTGGTGGSRKS